MRDPVETPASPSPESAPPRPGRWLAGGLRALLAGVLGLVTAAVLVVGWLGGTGAGLRFATGLAESLSGGLVVIDDAGGYLLGQLRLGRVHVRTPTLHLEVRNLHLDWQPGALLGLRLEVERLAASEVRVATVPSAEPARLPASLEAPLAVHLGELRIDRLSLAGLADGLPASPHLELTALAGQLDSDGRTHRFRHLAAATPFGLVAGEAELSGLRPFPLNMKASLATHQGGEAYDVRLTGDGSLESLTLAATASGAGMAGQLAAVATPFASLPLRSARLQVTDVNPRHFHEAAPAARLDIEVDLRPSVAAGHQGDKPLATGDWVVSGPLRIVNRAPDALDRGALPLESLSSRLRWAEGVLTMSGLAVRLPGKGRVDGEAQWQAPERDATGFGRVSAELTLAAVDARRLDGRAVATRIAGRLVARADAGVQTLLADLRDPQLALRVKARHEAGQVRIEEALVTAREARLEASGRLALEGNGRFEVTGLLSRFDPRAFVPAAPQADLNTRFTLQGQRHPRLAAHLDVLLSPSRLDGRSLSGSGRLAVDGTRVSEADVHLDLAGNRFAAQGRYGQPGDALTLQLDAPALASLGRGLGGRLKAEGVLRGTPAQPAGEFELQGEQLRAGALSIDGLRGRGRLAEGRDGAISILLDSGEVRTATEGEDAKLLLRRSSLVFEGTRAANGLRLEVQDLAEHSLMLRLRGRLSEGVRWEGFLEGVEVAGRFPVKLLAPAPLLLSSETVRLGLAEFQGGGGGLYRLEETRWQARQLVARGRMSGAQVGLILDPATRRVRSRGDSLQIGGEWDVNFGEQADGFVRIYREQGDLTLRGDTPVRLGLEDLQLTLSAAASRLAFGFHARGSQLGTLSGAATALAERTAEGRIRLVPGAPLLGAASLDMPSIAWAGPLADQNLKTDGSLKGEFTFSGTPARPEAAGRLRGEQLNFVMADQGLHLSGGTLVADFNREVLRLDEFSFVSPNRVRPREGRIDVDRLTRTPGTLKASGQIQLASGEGRFRFQADRLPLLQRPDQWLVLSGEGDILSGWSSAHLKGRLAADAGFVELSRTPAPSLGDDVEVMDPARGQKAPENPFQMGVDLAIALGDALYVKALGLDTRLAGELRLQSGPGRPLGATGTIITQGGVFEGYGQKLSIEKGIVTFNGPVANPSLNVVALRKGLAVEAGVGITGTARRPVVRLVSEPNVPDPEKLGWIVLGRPPDQGSGGEMALLLPAAQALLGGTGGGMSASLANALGFDEISLGAGYDPRGRVQSSSVATGSVTGASAYRASGSTVPGQVVTIGKRLSARAMLSFEQSVTGTSSIVKLTYQLTRRIALIGRTGSENALDTLFSISFR